MEIRPLELPDAEASLKLAALAFGYSADISTAETRFTPGASWGAFVDGALAAQMACLPFEMRYDGQWVPMGGIAGVATLPEHRRRGAVRRLFDAVFPAMRAAGQAFSVLYPFSFSYYRKFGYEAVYRVNRLTIPCARLDGLPTLGHARLLEPSEPLDALQGVYERANADRNLALRREETRWREKHLPADPWREKRYVYLGTDAQGEPCAYAVLAPEDAPEGRLLRVRDWAAVGADGIRAVFGLLAAHRAHYRAVAIDAPADLRIDVLLDEYDGVICRTDWSTMVRVVDVEAALRLTRWSPRAGRIVLRVHDDLLAWNNAAFAITFGERHSVERSTDAPDLDVDIRALAQLLFGMVTLDEPTAALLSGLAIAPTANRALLTAAFPRKLMGTYDHF